MSNHHRARPVSAVCRLAAGLRSTLALALTTGLLLALAACGPGVGGTGTGDTPSALPAFGAAPASVCEGDLAVLLACPTGGGTATPAPGAGPVYLADTIDGRQLRVTAVGNRIELQAPCAALQFRGEWGVVEGQPGRFYGYTDPDGAAMPASLQVQSLGGGLLLTLRGAADNTLLGPVLVTVVSGPGTVGSCS